MCALNLKENNKAGFEDTVLKVAMSEAKSRVENEYRETFSKDTKLEEQSANKRYNCTIKLKLELRK